MVERLVGETGCWLLRPCGRDSFHYICLFNPDSEGMCQGAGVSLSPNEHHLHPLQILATWVNYTGSLCSGCLTNVEGSPLHYYEN